MNDTKKIIEQAIRGKRTEATAGTAKMKKAVKMTTMMMLLVRMATGGRGKQRHCQGRNATSIS